MRSDRIGGRLDWRDLAAPSRAEFSRLTRAEQAAAVRRLAAEGHDETAIVRASGLSVEAVRRVLGEAARASALPMKGSGDTEKSPVIPANQAAPGSRTDAGTESGAAVTPQSFPADQPPPISVPASEPER